MHLKIKELADAAIALQNKIQMEAALREISALANQAINAPAVADSAKPAAKGVK